jgi:hypothetical protein
MSLSDNPLSREISLEKGLDGDLLLSI